MEEFKDKKIIERIETESLIIEFDGAEGGKVWFMDTTNDEWVWIRAKEIHQLINFLKQFDKEYD